MSLCFGLIFDAWNFYISFLNSIIFSICFVFVLRTSDIKPVIALPYEPKNWNTRNVMKILGKVSLLEMNDITWQLGAGKIQFCM